MYDLEQSVHSKYLDHIGDLDAAQRSMTADEQIYFATYVRPVLEYGLDPFAHQFAYLGEDFHSEE